MIKQPFITFIPSTRAINAMCKLFADYKANADPRASLSTLRRELGEDYSQFERALKGQLKRVPLWKAVSNIIGEAIRRNKESANA